MSKLFCRYSSVKRKFSRRQLILLSYENKIEGQMHPSLTQTLVGGYCKLDMAISDHYSRCTAVQCIGYNTLLVIRHFIVICVENLTCRAHSNPQCMIQGIQRDTLQGIQKQLQKCILTLFPLSHSLCKFLNFSKLPIRCKSLK